MHTSSSITTNSTFLNFCPESVNTPIPVGAVAYEERDNRWKLDLEGSSCMIIFWVFYDVLKTGGKW